MKPYDASYFDKECCKPFDFQGSEDGVLLIHGFTGCVSHMRPLGDALHKQGFTVKGINLPGHATTEDDMGKNGWREWLQAAKQATLEMMDRCKTVTVSGLSMGGVLCLLVAEEMKINACVPISAPMGTQNKFINLASIVWPFYPRISWGEEPERAKAVDPDYDFGYTGFPTRCARDLNKLIQLSRRNLFNINCPVLAVQSDGDQSVWPGSADCILEGVSSEKKQKLWLHEVPHVCTLSKELPNIAQTMGDFIRASVHE